MTPVFISGVGSVSCVGVGASALWNSVCNDETGIQNGFGLIHEGITQDLKKSLSLGDTSRAIIYALAAAREAMTQAHWKNLGPEDAMILATTTGQIDLWESAIIDYLKGSLTPEQFRPACHSQALSGTIETLSHYLDFTGKTLLVSSACSAATQALAIGAQLINSGKVKRCLVGGVEILSQLTIEGFRSLQLLNPEPATPFDAKRQGINLAEGAGFICLEKESAAPLAAIKGFGMTSDAYHMTSPQPEGAGCFAAMTKALGMAQLAPESVQWVHAHGTGSKANDQAEGAAIQRLFSGAQPWVSSTKGIHGHTLGASGAIETILCVRALSAQKIPRSYGLKNPDVSLRHPTTLISGPLNNILKNTLGFGGNNAALVLTQ